MGLDTEARTEDGLSAGGGGCSFLPGDRERVGVRQPLACFGVPDVDTRRIGGLPGGLLASRQPRRCASEELSFHSEHTKIKHQKKWGRRQEVAALWSGQPRPEQNVAKWAVLRDGFAIRFALDSAD